MKVEFRVMIELLHAFSCRKYLNESKPDISIISKPFLTKFPRTFDQTTFYAVFLLGPAFIFICVGMVIEIVYDREVILSTFTIN